MAVAMKTPFHWFLAAMLIVAAWFIFAGGGNPPLNTAASLLQTLPEDRAVHAYLDLALLRRAELLSASSASAVPEEADYLRFVYDTGFDYRSDLDAVALAFVGGNPYIAARGRFDWPRLVAYARSHQGFCANTCQVPASQPGRVVSFRLLGKDILALAVSEDKSAVDSIHPHAWVSPPRVPAVAAWVSAPGSVFRSVSSLPQGSHAFFSPLADTRNAVFTLGAGNAGYEIRLDATTAAAPVAAEIVKQLTETTGLLKKMLARDKMTPKPGELSGVLTGGQFEARGADLAAHWPLDRRFLDTLLSGKLQ